MHPISSIAAHLPIAPAPAAPVGASHAGQATSFQDLLRASLERARAADPAQTSVQPTQSHILSHTAERAATAYREITHIIG